MDLSKNQYRKFLIDEVLRASNANVSTAFKEVTEFSKTKEFSTSYEKWVYLNKKNAKRIYRPKSMKEIFSGIDINANA